MGLGKNSQAVLAGVPREVAVLLSKLWRCHKERQMARSSLQVANEEYMVEFPFIRPWIEKLKQLGPEPKISVQKLDLDVLVDCPYQVEGTFRRYFCVGRDGQVLFEVPKKEKVYGDLFSLWRPRTWFRKIFEGQTVDEALSASGYLSQVGYVVRVESVPGKLQQIIIYKVVPGTLDFASYFRAEEERIRHKARERLQKELNGLK